MEAHAGQGPGWDKHSPPDSQRPLGAGGREMGKRAHCNLGEAGIGEEAAALLGLAGAGPFIPLAAGPSGFVSGPEGPLSLRCFSPTSCALSNAQLFTAASRLNVQTPNDAPVCPL